MATSISSISTEVGARLGNRADIAARLLTWINFAFYELTMSPRYSFYELDKTETFPTVASTREYTLPTDLWWIMSIRDDTNQRKIDKRDISQFDAIFYTEGQPTRYCRFEDQLHLDPTPDDVYTVRYRYRKRPVELVIAGSTGLGDEWTEPLILLATVKGMEALRMYDDATKARMLYDATMAPRQDAPELDYTDADWGLAPAMDGERFI